ncbi:phosphoenolpyruvate--protein phosphotransferase [Sphingosinicella sp. BN140058]|uniref:phosphoenolpyruvate--protein phosphotransferase n=1 Tax=Sphingosinicella sp. BN140058 TaxID=1892855 RepID=UPI00101275E1|nr:phosphoenolpyruvate--protein phosphotransferase [Sphingosinicella sp. BN140058]QAY77873.1 phosphoenolpyruvate--protein phosphotransferase [Sphingosinicella sp. BN140058]
MRNVVLLAPAKGWASGLDEVPDEVFAGRMMGDGMAIDPLAGEIVAPCDGTITLIAQTGHAVTLRAANGAEVLIHVGLETVRLGGKGFTAHVGKDAQVRAGDLLISFDIDAIALDARSMVTPIVVTNSEMFRFTVEAQGLVAAGAPIGTIEAIEEGARDGAEKAGSSAVRDVLVSLPNGIHARPAARIAAGAKAFNADVTLRAKDGEARARSPVSVMALDIRAGDRIEIHATGPDAEAAASALATLIETELPALEDHSPPVRAASEPASAPATSAGAEPGRISGVCAVPGLVIGTAVQLRKTVQEVAREGKGAAEERRTLDTALSEVRANLAAASAGREATAAAIATAHLELIEDDDILEAAHAGLARGESAGFAWRSALAGVAADLQATGNPLLQERVQDLLDLERQVLAVIGGEQRASLPDFPADAIVLAEGILPSDVVALTGRIAGLCTADGGPTSHVAVLAAAAGLPTMVAAGHGLARIPDGTRIILDAAAGRIDADPTPDDLAAAETRIAAAAETRRRDEDAAKQDCRTADGVRIELFANLASVEEAAAAVAVGAEGCGLLRTEFLFLEREAAPSENEQRTVYQAIADALGDRPLIVRTLDVGGDKPIPFLPIPHEDNPALGLRGVRTSLWRPDLLDDQLRAILRVRPAGRCRIMVPMVSGLDELREVRERAHAVAAEIGETAPFELGVMIETPAAAMLVDQLAAEADFFSVGTNDLTQYTLAMDRTNALVAAQVDAFHPAVLRLIGVAAEAARRRGRVIGACGGLASDPLGACLLVGLGLTELSVTAAYVPTIKARLRGITVAECTALAERALAQTSTADVRRIADEPVATIRLAGASA